MKTTIDIADALLHEARDLAAHEGGTLRGLVERGLRRVLDDARDRPPFKLRRASFKGRGLHADFRDGGWDRIRDTIYADRGG